MNKKPSLIDSEKRKHWITFLNKHRFIDPETCLQLNHNHKPLPYRLTIWSIDKIKIPFKPKTQSHPDSLHQNSFYINFNTTFFSKSQNKYFGRTYKSRPIPLVKNDRENSWRTAKEHTIFYHSNAQSDSDVIMI